MDTMDCKEALANMSCFIDGDVLWNFARRSKNTLRAAAVAALIYGFILGYYENGVLERAPGHFKLPVANLGLDYGEPSRWMSLSVPGEA